MRDGRLQTAPPPILRNRTTYYTSLWPVCAGMFGIPSCTMGPVYAGELEWSLNWKSNPTVPHNNISLLLYSPRRPVLLPCQRDLWRSLKKGLPFYTILHPCKQFSDVGFCSDFPLCILSENLFQEWNLLKLTEAFSILHISLKKVKFQLAELTSKPCGWVQVNHIKIDAVGLA